MTLAENRKIVVVLVAIFATLVIAIPLTAFALPISENNIASSRTLVAKGVAKEIVNGESVTFPANFTLILERAGDKNAIPRFDVVGGSVVVNGVPFTISSGNGGVLRGRRLILLQAQGSSADGQAVTLKLAGRYFWMGGRLYVARIGARLLTPNANYTLLLRAGIRV